MGIEHDNAWQTPHHPYYPFGCEHRGNWNQDTRNNHLYTGQERQGSFKLEYLRFMARHSDPLVMGRFQSVDPNAHKYPSWSPYNYVYNNPVNGIDPDGRDGILLVWKNYPAGGHSFTGHAGVLLIDNKTGLTKYYEYGRYPPSGDLGRVRHYSVPDVVMGDDGRPTAESLNNVLSAITKQSGTKDGKSYDLTGAYFKSNDFEAMNKYAQSRLADNSVSGRDPYSTLSNNCGDFGCETLKQDPNVNSQIEPLLEAPNPTLLIDQYKSRSDYNLQYKPGSGTTIQYPEKTTNYNQSSGSTTSSQSWWQRLWNGKIHN